MTTGCEPLQGEVVFRWRQKMRRGPDCFLFLAGTEADLVRRGVEAFNLFAPQARHPLVLQSVCWSRCQVFGLRHAWAELAYAQRDDSDPRVSPPVHWPTDAARTEELLAQHAPGLLALARARMRQPQ